MYYLSIAMFVSGISRNWKRKGKVRWKTRDQFNLSNTQVARSGVTLFSSDVGLNDAHRGFPASSKRCGVYQ
jgi:hypothetical protein